MAGDGGDEATAAVAVTYATVEMLEAMRADIYTKLELQKVEMGNEFKDKIYMKEATYSKIEVDKKFEHARTEMQITIKATMDVQGKDVHDGSEGPDTGECRFW